MFFERVSFLALCIFVTKVSGTYEGSLTCHTGEDIPGSTHSGQSGGLLSVKVIFWL